MITTELFSGTKSFSKVMELHNHATFTIDNDDDLNPDLTLDLANPSFMYIINTHNDMLWASPPCTSFSVASIGKNWKDRLPTSEGAKLGIILLDNTIKFISINKPTKWYIENPRGMMRIVIDDIFKKHNITNYRRVTISYCQYGDTRMKPTDIWTNDFDWKPRPMCKPKSSCHVSAPRGSRTGTQGLKNAKDRGVIPPQLFEEILNHIK